MDLLELIQRDIDEIAEWGHCNFAETFKTLILAKKEIEELRSKVNNSVLDDVKVCERCDGKGFVWFFPDESSFHTERPCPKCRS